MQNLYKQSSAKKAKKSRTIPVFRHSSALTFPIRMLYLLLMANRNVPLTLAISKSIRLKFYTLSLYHRPAGPQQCLKKFSLVRVK